MSTLVTPKVSSTEPVSVGRSFPTLLQNSRRENYGSRSTHQRLDGLGTQNRVLS